MDAALVIGLTLGAVLGLRFNVWALLVCLAATIPVATAAMFISSHSLSSAMLAAFLYVTSMEVGYLAGAYAAQMDMLRRAARLQASSINRPSSNR
jgi:hypothetical protein